MLALGVSEYEDIRIGESIVLRFKTVSGKSLRGMRILIEAPREMKIRREKNTPESRAKGNAKE